MENGRKSLMIIIFHDLMPYGAKTSIMRELGNIKVNDLGMHLDHLMIASIVMTKTNH